MNRNGIFGSAGCIPREVWQALHRTEPLIKSGIVSGVSLMQRPVDGWGSEVGHWSRMCGRLASRGAMKATFGDARDLKFSNLLNLLNLIKFAFTKNPYKTGTLIKIVELHQLF